MIKASSDIRSLIQEQITGQSFTRTISGATVSVGAASAQGLATYVVSGLGDDIYNLLDLNVTIAGMAANNNGTFRVSSFNATTPSLTLYNPGATVQVVAGTVSASLIDRALHIAGVGGGGVAADVEGNIAHNAVDGTSMPVKVGGVARILEQTAVSADGNRVNAAYDRYGKQKVVMPGFVVREYDYAVMTYVAGDVPSAGEIATAIFKTGGAGGTTVATLTMAYDAVTGDLLTVTKS